MNHQLGLSKEVPITLPHVPVCPGGRSLSFPPVGPVQTPAGPVQTPAGPVQTPDGPVQTPTGPVQPPKTGHNSPPLTYNPGAACH